MPSQPSGDPDASVLQQLASAGDDPAKSRIVNFYLYFPTEKAAQAAAAEIAQSGFLPVVRPAAKGPEWLCFATKSTVPTLEALHVARKQLNDAAQRNGGEYDGWESPVLKPAH
ncbi:MAG TPA: ribonuclease E inhibitor RraB [Thermoanaerobaculia bacterium]|nr:ribonuclease E inhibitor RraB [Thermoanaerobaculia bacterium]